MPGIWTLGCVLGRYDLSQSFDVASAAIVVVGSGGSAVNSWAGMSPQSSLDYFTAVHSSAQGMRIFSNSTQAFRDLLRYDYGRANDGHERWFPDVQTHRARLTAWARMDTAATSGEHRLVLIGSAGTAQGVIPFHASALQPITAELTGITSGGGFPHAVVSRAVVPGSGATSYIDDVVLQADWIQLNPEIGFADESPFLFESAGALGGRRDFFRWGRTFAWQVPLKYLSDSDASLLTWWWKNQFALAFTLDTSDAATVQLCRIVNDDNPVRRRMRPYGNLWEGGLQLESLHDGRLAL